jgi:hypothetical protein
LSSPTARSLSLLRASGFIAAAVERWIPGVEVRSDLWHFADLIAAHPIRREIMLVQVTTIGHVAHRLAKAKGRPELAAWLRAGGLFAVHGWHNRLGQWEPKIVEVRSEDLIDVVVQAPRRRGRQPVQPDLFQLHP